MKRIVSIKLGIPLEDAMAQYVKANFSRYENISVVADKLKTARGTVYKYLGMNQYEEPNVRKAQ